jgi:hypothetical protein
VQDGSPETNPTIWFESELNLRTLELFITFGQAPSSSFVSGLDGTALPDSS